MTVSDAVAHILKAEEVEYLFAYPINPLIESAAKVGIRPIIVRQERTGLHMADAFSRVTSGRRIGVFCMQAGPGTENAFGGVAQAFGDSVPILVLPAGYPRSRTDVSPSFNASHSFCNVTKSCEQLTVPEAVIDAMRRAFTQVKNGRPRPVLVEFPADLLSEDVSDPQDYRPAPSIRSAPDPDAVREAADILLKADRPLIYAGQGVHYAEAWQELADLAELLPAPVATSLQGKSAFPETHPLSVGAGGRSIPAMLRRFLGDADVIFGIGCSFAATTFGVRIPAGRTVLHATLDSADINKDVESQLGLVGDAQLTLSALLREIRGRLHGKPKGDSNRLAASIAAVREEWLSEWKPKLTSDEVPISPYRVIWDLLHTVDVDNTIITHDAGSPRDQLSPFWECTTPLSYIGWGKTTQLGYGLGLAMGAKLARPDKLCINVWGDAAIGFTGMDIETAARERIPILSILFNNSCMAIELPVMPISTEKYGSTNITGNYSDLARSLGAYAERVESPDQIIPAVERGIQKTAEGEPVLLEFITAKEIEFSLP